MPRKKNPRRFPQYTTPIHPSLSTSSTPSASKGHHHIPRSLHSAPSTTGNLVNDLIQRQRLSCASPTPKVPETSPSIQAQTLPPSLDTILQGSDHIILTDPEMTHYTRWAGFFTNTAGRGPAGPPPPSSWLQPADHVPREQDPPTEDEDEDHHALLRRTKKYPPFDPLPGLSLPDERSFQFQTLKSLAIRWDWHMEHDRDNLVSLPMKVKEQLLYFVAKYNPGTMTCDGLKALFWGNGGLEDVVIAEKNLTHLDLGTSIDSYCTLNDLIDTFVKPPHAISASKQENDKLIVPDAWDAPEAASIIHHQLASFSYLTHLSLAHPVEARWKTLLRIAPHLATLTHLSLAYWPPPSFRPVKNWHPRRPHSFYSSQWKILGNGRHEAPTILRQLSRATYCLKWLDLTGCCGWLWALQCADGPDWAGSWRGVQLVKAGEDLPPRLAIESGVNQYIERQRNNDNSVMISDWSRICKWLWYVRSIEELEWLVNQLRTDPPSSVVWRDDAVIFEDRTRNPDSLALSTTTTTNSTAGPRIAPSYDWYFPPTDEFLLASVQLGSERHRGDGHVVFESSPDEQRLLAQLIETFRARGEPVESINTRPQ